MCTAFSLCRENLYFGRNLDLDCGFGEHVVITPRSFPFSFSGQHHALIGMATVVDNYPLYAEAMNEKGLVMAGLQFTGNACYFPEQSEKINVASYEIIPWVLAQFDSVEEAKKALCQVSICERWFSSNVPSSPLHWILSDSQQSIVLESCEDGLHIYEDSFGVLTNNPPFPFHVWNMDRYLNLTKEYPSNRFGSYDLKPYANGMGAIGLPGDASSPSRFVKTAYLKDHLSTDGTEKDTVQQVFRILDAVSMIKGSVGTEKNTEDYTVYSSVMNVTKGLFYVNTYENRTISRYDLFSNDLEGTSLFSFPLNREGEWYFQE